MKAYIKKADIVLFVLLVVIGLGASFAVYKMKSSGDTVLIKSDNELYGKYSLYEDARIVVKNGKKSNTVVIEDGKVRVEEANCHNQLCVNHAEISEAGESIICLPNKVLVSIEGKGGGGYDSVSS